MKWTRARLATGTASVLALAACGGGDDAGSGGGDTGSKGDIKVGAFNFPESVLLANIYADALTKAGYNATGMSGG